MDERSLVREFENLAERLDITIRYHRDETSGLCTVRGRRVLFLDQSLPPSGMIDVYIRELKSLNLNGLYLPPVIRECLGKVDDDGAW